MGRKDPKYPTETYPRLDDDLVGNASAVLEQYRQSVIGRDPLPLEWLFDSLRDGEVKDLAYYKETARQAEADHEKAIEAAGGPFDASYRPPPVELGAEQEAAEVVPPPPPPVAPADDRSVEEKGADEQEEAGIVEAAEVDATPAAEALAAELGVELAEVEGSGEEGRVLVSDVKDAAEDDGA